MSKPIESNEQIKVVIGKPKGNITPSLANNGGIVKLLKHFDMNVSIVSCFQEELVAAGWMTEELPTETFKKIAEQIAQNIQSKVSTLRPIDHIVYLIALMVLRDTYHANMSLF